MHQPPGWYYAQGDPPGTQRYWDGELWIGEPQMTAAPLGPPPPPGGYAAGGYPGGGYHAYPESSQATTALVLSILSFFICSIAAPITWGMASREIRAIDAGRRDPKNRGTAMAAKVISIIMTLLLIAGIALIVLVVSLEALNQ